MRGLKPNYLPGCYRIYAESHPAWVRGLKLDCSAIAFLVAASHPAWVRGLKQNIFNEAAIKELSHPAWVRGLKQW